MFGSERIYPALDGVRTAGRRKPSGEKQNRPFQLCFNASLKADFQGSHVRSDSGLVLVRESDERLGRSELIGRHRHLREEHAVAARGLIAPVGVEPFGGRSRLERCGTPSPRHCGSSVRKRSGSVAQPGD